MSKLVIISYREPNGLLGHGTLALHVCRAEHGMRPASLLRSLLALILRLPGPPLGNLAPPFFRALNSHGGSRPEADAIDAFAVIVRVEQ
jgi:hypothetical protein